MRLFRISVSVLGLFIVVCFLTVAALILFVNPNQLKPVLAKEVMKQTGYQVVIDGNLSWSVYPRLGVKIIHMTLTAPHESKPFLDLRGAKIAMSLSQILLNKNKWEGKIYIDQVHLMNMDIQKVNTFVSWQNHLLTLQPIKASFYQGSLEGYAHGTSLTDVPHWDWDMQAKHVELQSLLQDVNGGNSQFRFSGMGQFKLQGSTEGKNKNDLIQQLAGTVEFSLDQGVVEGINLNYLIQTADALINKQAVTLPTIDENHSLNQTTFDHLTGTATIKGGVIKTNDLNLIAPDFTTKGQGVLTLSSQAIDFQLQIKPQRNDSDATKKDWEIPVSITGSLKQPDVRLDINQIQKKVVVEQIEKVKEKVKNKVKDKARDLIDGRVKEKAAELLRNLLGNQG